MKPATRRTAIVLAVIIAILAALPFVSSRDFGFAPSPDKILQAIRRDENFRPNFTYESPIANLAGRDQCLHISHDLHAGERQTAMNAFKWVIDVPVGDAAPTRSADRLAQLNALAEVGLLSRERVPVIQDSQTQLFDRYRLTVKGWAASKGREQCILLGRARHLAVTGVRKVDLERGADAGKSFYAVTVLVGLPDTTPLPEWADNPAMRAAFPLINQLDTGFESELALERTLGVWREYVPATSIARMAESGQTRSTSYFNPVMPEVGGRALTEDQVAATLLDPVYKERFVANTNCIDLPGTSSNGRLRVDRDFGNRVPERYKVAIFDGKERTEYDTTVTQTLPYLERLVAAGVLTSTREERIEGGRRDEGRVFSGTVFQLAPQYLEIMTEGIQCFPLGDGEIEIVDIEIIPGNSSDSPFGAGRIVYKYLYKTIDPPAWARDPALQGWWPELKGALENGRACDGNFDFDAASSDFRGAGGGSCWWAFDSTASL